MDVGKAVRSIKEGFCFIKEFFQRVWKRIPVGLVEKYLGGTVESWKSCFGHMRWPRRKNGSPLPISLQKKLVFKKVFNKDIDVSYSREKLSLTPCNPRVVPVPCYCQIAYPLLLSKVVCEYNS